MRSSAASTAWRTCAGTLSIGTMLRLMLLSLLSLGRTTAIGSPPAKLYVAVWTMPPSVIAGTLKISQPTTKASTGSSTRTPSTPSVQLRTR